MTGFRRFNVLMVAGLLSAQAFLVATSGMPGEAAQQVDPRTVRPMAGSSESAGWMARDRRTASPSSILPSVTGSHWRRNSPSLARDTPSR
jgi:hypothetical protein